jgi:hypothetical protein
MLDFVFTAFTITFVSVACLGFYFVLKLSLEERRINMRKYKYDDLGNPEYYFDERTGYHFLPLAQNKAFAEPENFVIGNSPVTPLPKNAPMRPMFTYINGKPKTYESEPPIEPKELDELGSVLPEPDFVGQLATAKRSGHPMKASIRRITGVTAGGTPAYEEWRKIWMELPAV